MATLQDFLNEYPPPSPPPAPSSIRWPISDTRSWVALGRMDEGLWLLTHLDLELHGMHGAGQPAHHSAHYRAPGAPEAEALPVYKAGPPAVALLAHLDREGVPPRGAARALGVTSGPGRCVWAAMSRAAVSRAAVSRAAMCGVSGGGKVGRSSGGRYLAARRAVGVGIRL